MKQHPGPPGGGGNFPPQPPPANANNSSNIGATAVAAVGAGGGGDPGNSADAMAADNSYKTLTAATLIDAIITHQINNNRSNPQPPKTDILKQLEPTKATGGGGEMSAAAVAVRPGPAESLVNAEQKVSVVKITTHKPWRHPKQLL